MRKYLMPNSSAAKLKSATILSVSQIEFGWALGGTLARFCTWVA
jgi:hypothetical protein